MDLQPEVTGGKGGCFFVHVFFYAIVHCGVIECAYNPALLYSAVNNYSCMKFDLQMETDDEDEWTPSDEEIFLTTIYPETIPQKLKLK